MLFTIKKTCTRAQIRHYKFVETMCASTGWVCSVCTYAGNPFDAPICQVWQSLPPAALASHDEVQKNPVHSNNTAIEQIWTVNKHDSCLIDISIFKL